jgi:ribosomal protein S18 acetylase RimI-like enzyme
MCVIAGYIGKKQAAPILLEMLRREEGLAGGFYTGIATVYESALQMEKVVGDVETLIQQTSSLRLPGNIGIAHSRTPSGGGREWGHPFVDTSEQMAYIANGSVGKFENLEQLAALSQELMEAGHRFSSAQKEPVASYPVLKNGLSVHFSDTYCQAIAAAYQRVKCVLQAAWEVYQDVPGELVGLCLHAAHPDEIVAVRHNKPLEIGRDDEGGIYLASTTLAFPPGVLPLMRMPAGAAASIHRDGTIEVKPFVKSTFKVGPFPSTAALEERVNHLLRGNSPPTFATLCDAVKPLWAEDCLNEKEIALFEMLASLSAEKRVRLENESVPGMFGKGKVPRTRIYWNWQHAQRPLTMKEPPAEIRIRPATLDDLSAIGEITAAAFGLVSFARISQDYFGEPLGGKNWDEYKSKSVMDEARQCVENFIIAEIDDVIVGYASVLFDEECGLATVGHNAVLPKYQGRGIGSALQREVIRRFREKGYTRWKVTTLAHDYPAQRVYEKMGFEEVTRSIVYLRCDKAINSL